MTMCGIPSITLEGTVDDWKSIREVNALVPVLDRFVAAVCGNTDKDQWSNLYKYNNGSGDTYVTCWITKLFLNQSISHFV